MEKIVSESNKRIIIKGILNGKEADILVDTGATVGLIDKSCEKKYGLKINKNKSFKLEGAGGSFKAYLVETPLELKGNKVYQFLLADIGNIIKSVFEETGIKIEGIISLSQCKMLNVAIDTDDNYITIGK